MGSIGVVEILILGLVGLAGVTLATAGVVIYALTRKQKYEGKARFRHILLEPEPGSDVSAVSGPLLLHLVAEHTLLAEVLGVVRGHRLDIDRRSVAH